MRRICDNISYVCLRRELYKTHGMRNTTYECTYYRLITTLIFTPRDPVMRQQHMSEGPREHQPPIARASYSLVSPKQVQPI